MSEARTVTISVDEYTGLLKDRLILTDAQKYILRAIRNKRSHYVSTDLDILIMYLGITEEADEVNEEAEKRLADEKLRKEAKRNGNEQ